VRAACGVASADDEFHIPAFDVEVRDTTGAGDCFNAAFVSAWLHGWPLREMARFACAAAALSVQAIGARGGLPSEEDVFDFIAVGNQYGAPCDVGGERP
jgi:ribokinase/sulfofructose kinase